MKLFLRLFIFSFVALLFSQCSKSQRVPLITTIEPTAGVNVFITGSAVVYSEGDAPITSKGYCWALSGDPTIADNVVEVGSGPDNFTVTIKGLQKVTRYRVCAFATNKYGTAYGNTYDVQTGQGPALSQMKSSGTYSMTLNSAVCTSSITNLAFVGKVAEAGICWANSTSPSTLDAHSTAQLASNGTYTCNLSNLNTNTVYYYRPYVINDAGISYGTVSNFKTYSGTVQDFDNNTYFTIEIGTQVWLAQNLRVTHYTDGTPIANITSNVDWYNAGFGGSSCYYGNVSSNAVPHGLIYDYNAVMNSKLLGIPGWHLPSQSEYLTLFNNTNGYVSASSSLKSAEPGQWVGLVTQPFTSGFNGYPSGFRDTYGSFLNKNTQAFFWTATVDQNKSGYLFSLYDYSTSSFNYYSVIPGASVRLVKN